MTFTEQQFEKATREIFLAHGKNLAIHQSRGECSWMAALMPMGGSAPIPIKTLQ